MKRASEVLGTLSDGEMTAFMVLIGAKESIGDPQAQAHLLMLRGTFAGGNMTVADLQAMREEIGGSYDALTRATQSLLEKLDGLLEEAGSQE